MDAGHCSISEHAVRGAERSSRGWWVGEKFMWTIIHAGKGCGERVKESGEATLKDNDGGEG